MNDAFVTTMNRLQVCLLSVNLLEYFLLVNVGDLLFLPTQEARNALKALCVEGLIDSLNGMGQKLEKIQKSLDDYLEQKRQQFPRFYFLSSDDLLDILGQAKDPRNVQASGFCKDHLLAGKKNCCRNHHNILNDLITSLI